MALELVQRPIRTTEKNLRFLKDFGVLIYASLLLIVRFAVCK